MFITLSNKVNICHDQVRRGEGYFMRKKTFKRNIGLLFALIFLIFTSFLSSSCSKEPTDEVIEKAVLKAKYSNIENKRAFNIQRGKYNKNEKAWAVRVQFSIVNEAGTGVVQPYVYEYKIHENDFGEWVAELSRRHTQSELMR